MLKRRGLCGLLRLVFDVDLRSRIYRSATRLKKPTAKQIREAEKRTGSERRQRGNARGSEGWGDTTATAKNVGLWSRAVTEEL